MFEKVVLYTMLFEVVGLGCGFGPLNNRFFPPMGSILYWMRFGTIRLPPWPDRVPLTKGTKRTPVDVALYAVLLVVILAALFSDGTGPMPELGTNVGLLPTWEIVRSCCCSPWLGLRDKVIFLAARGEVYATMTVTFLFGARDMIVAAKLVFLVIWMGAATSKLNKHFPFVISTMMSNNPLLRPSWLKRRFFEHFPDDLRPGRLSRLSRTSAPPSRCACRWCCSSPTAAGRSRSPRSSWWCSTSASSSRSRWACRWSGTSS